MGDGERKAGRRKRSVYPERENAPSGWFPFTEKHAVIPIARGFESYDCMTSARFLAATNDLGLPPLIFALSTSEVVKCKWRSGHAGCHE